MRVFIFIFTILAVPASAWAFDHSHQTFNEVLSDVVKPSGKTTVVDYNKLKEKPQKLEAYLKTLSSIAHEEYDQFTKPQQLSFLINAYNAFTLKLIIDHYPVSSIRNIRSLTQWNPWKRKFFQLLGQSRNLDWVEHEVIRGQASEYEGFEEPRIHFAVNCASVGCPSLLPEAFLADRLDEQLEKASRSFIQDESRNRFDSESQTLYLSKIFEWYGGDFDSAGGVQRFVSTRMTGDMKLQERIKNSQSLQYLEYDWNLNEER